MDDATLVERVHDGDAAALDTLLERHQADAYTVALRLLGNRADAEDVLQETLVRAYTRVSDLKTGAAFSAWIRRMATNLSLNVLRRRGQIAFESLDAPRNAPSSTPPTREFEDVAATPEDAVLSLESRDELEAVIRSLPAEQRVAVVLRDIYDYDVAEIASLQRCGISAAKMRIVRGRTALRKLLEGRNGS